MHIRFTKMQGAGNDFVVLDETKGPLGLSPGLIAPGGDTDKAKKAFGLELPNNLTLTGKDAIAAAVAALSAAISSVRSAYKGLAPPSANSLTNTLTGKGGSTAYFNAQAANFQAALDRLGGMTA